MKFSSIKRDTVKKYIARLNELKKVAFKIINTTKLQDETEVDQPSDKIESAFSFVDE